MDKLAEQTVTKRLKDHRDWVQAGDAIQRTFSFDTFNEAIEFVNEIANLAEERNHHPDILIRYNKVTLTLSTHDAGGLTDLDFDFAADVDGMLAHGSRI